MKNSLEREAAIVFILEESHEVHCDHNGRGHYCQSPWAFVDVFGTRKDALEREAKVRESAREVGLRTFFRRTWTTILFKG
jgi:hypothetical protein